MDKPSKRAIDPRLLLDQAEKLFLLGDETEFVFPLRRPAGDADFYERLDRELRDQELVRVHALREVKEGFTWISRPAALALDVEGLLRERPSLSILKGEINKLSAEFRFIDVRAFLRREGSSTWHDLATFRSCLEILDYLLKHPAEVKGLLAKQLPHGQSTKLIGREMMLLRLFMFWRGEPADWKDFYQFFELLEKPLEFRFYAPQLICQGRELSRFHGVLASEWMADFDFSALRATLIVENFDSFVALASEARTTLLIWGAGWRAVHLRKFTNLLPRPVYYWGDIDKEGYEIYGSLRFAYPQLTPVLMDQSVIEKYKDIQQRKDIFVGPFRSVPELQSEYEFACRNGLQIEQEQIREPWPFATDLG